MFLVLVPSAYADTPTATGPGKPVHAEASWKAYLHEGRIDDAVTEIRRLADQPGHEEAVIPLARLYETVGAIDLAVETYQRAVLLPELPDYQGLELVFRLDHCRRQRASLVRFPYSVEALSEIRQVDALLETRQWHAAFNTMAGILERFEGQFLRSGPGESMGLWGWARELLVNLPPEGQDAFVAWSVEAWETALEDGSVQAVRQFLTAHPAPASMQRGLLSWARTLADQGHFDRALGILERRDLDPEQTVLLREGWKPLADRSAHSQHLNLTADVDADLTGPDLIDAAVDPSRGLRIPALPNEDNRLWGWSADTDTLYLARHFRVEAYDLHAGQPKWCRTFDRGGDRYNVHRDVFDQERDPRQKWTGALDRPGITATPAGVLVVHAYHEGDRAYVTRTLTCLDRETGHPRWELDRDPLFERLRVCSDPVYSGGKILIVASSRGRFPSYWLIALNADDGAVVWKHHIAIGATPTECMGRGVLYAGQSGPTLIVDHETVYYTTHMGAVVAVDRELGQPIWAVSYPRIARYGPQQRGPLPLLERRTEPILMTAKYLVLLPRDLNGVLVIDRSKGKIATVLRSLDLLELIDATDEHVIVRSLAGELRKLRIADGRPEWEHRPGNLLREQRPIHWKSDFFVPHGDRVSVMDIDSGQARSQKGPAGLQMYRVAPAGHWLAITDEALRVITAPDGQSERCEPGSFLAAGTEASKQRWFHEAYVPGLDAQSRMVRSSHGTMLLSSDREGLSVYRLAGDGAADAPQRMWRRDFVSDATVWGVSYGSTVAHARLHREEPEPATPAADIVAWSDDGITVRILDMATGEDLATGTVEGVSPIQALYGVGDLVLVESFAQVAWVRAAADGSLTTLWSRDFGSGLIEGVYPSVQETLVFVHGMGQQSGKVLKLDSTQWPDPVVADYNLPAPELSVLLFGQDSPADRYPVSRFSYAQDEVREDTHGLTLTRDGKTFDLAGMSMRLIAISDRFPGHALFELGEYKAAIRLADGLVTFISPAHTDNKYFANRSEEEALIFKWYRHRCGKGTCASQWRDPPPQSFFFVNREAGLINEFCQIAIQDARPKCAIFNPRGTKASLSLGHPMSDGLDGDSVEPTRMDRVGSRWMIGSSTGVLVLRELPEGLSIPDLPGKRAADLMKAPPVRMHKDFTPQLDADVSDWPEAYWHELKPSRHHWPPSAAHEGIEIGAPSVEASFQVGLDEEALWLAIRVRDDVHVAPSAVLSQMGDQVEILMARRLGLLRNPEWPRESPVPLRITLRIADGIVAGWCRARYYPTTLAQPVGADAGFVPWFERRYGIRPTMDEFVRVAGQRVGEVSTFEVRIDRILFADRHPGEFDVRVGDNDGNGVSTWLDWGGALNREEVYPVAFYETLPLESELSANE